MARYGLPAARLTLLQYEDNAVYRVDTAGGERFVLRIGAAEGHGAARQRSELAWLSALARDSDLLIPRPLPATDGALLATVGVEGVPKPRHCALFRWLPGRPPGPEVDAATAAAIGALAAGLHAHADRFVPPPDFARPTWDLDGLFPLAADPARLASRLSQHAQRILAATVARLRRQLAALRPGPADWGLIHADLHRGNLLVRQGRAGAIDFDDCGWGYRLFDLATVLSSLRRFVPPRAFAPLRAALLDGYARLRPLPAQLDAWLDAGTTLRELQIVAFIAGSNNAAVRAWGPARLAEIIAGLEREERAEG